MGFDGRAELPDRRPDRRRASAQNLEETGMGYDQEVEMIARGARDGPADLPLRLRRGRGARRWPRPGPTCSCAHMGLTTKGIDRREDGADARRVGARASRRCTTRRRRSGRTSSSSATAARSPSRRTPRTSSTTPPASSASSAPRASNACHRSRHRGPGPPVPRHDLGAPTQAASGSRRSGEATGDRATTRARGPSDDDDHGCSVIRRVLWAPR